MSRRRTTMGSRPPGLDVIAEFPLVSALLGRRARRFPMGGSIPDGPFAFTSKKPPVPLSELETALVLSAMTGNTGWHHAIPFNARYAPKIPNYSASAGGRVFPSAAGFHTTDFFYTDDSGTFFLSTRDRAAMKSAGLQDDFDFDDWVANHRKLAIEISDERLVIPREEPFVDGHNLWIANAPGSLFVVPVNDLAQHTLLGICYLVQNGYCVLDDLNGERIPGIDRFRHLVDVDNPLPLSYVEQVMLGETSVEVAISCYAGALMLQAMGLGGWMYDGIDRNTIFGSTGDPRAPGLGFRFDTDERWSTPNPTGLPGVFEAWCPPRFENMRAAVEAVVERKFGHGGPFHPSTPGPWKESSRIRSSAAPHDEEFKDCVTAQAQYVFDRFGKFPATTPSMYCLTYLQAQHIDLEFYDRFYEPGSYLDTHAAHHRDWH